ncbi:MAG: D-sedoheptulose 7-phosphate isomerase [bacterium]|nr:D-sedoheptulose 7-phosphate isomerase [bacterium]
MNSFNYIETEIKEAASAIKQALLIKSDIEKAASCITEAIEAGGKIFICGNGGSAADAQHMAAEFTGRFELERKAMPAIALSVDTSALTSISNDYSFEDVFARQLEALGRKGDVLIGISTSGNSKNVLRAFEKASELGISTIAMTGASAGRSETAADIKIKVPAQRTCRIQEAHAVIIHILCGIAEKHFRASEEAKAEAKRLEAEASGQSPKPLNIAIFTNAYKPIISGVVNCIDLMRKYLEKQGHNVYIFAPAYNGYEDPADEKVFRYPSVNLTNKVKFPVAIAFSPKAEKFLSENRIDVIHCHHPFILGDEGAKWAAKLNIPLFYTFHTQYEMYSHYIPLPQDLVKTVSKSVVSAFTKKCSVIITPGTAIVDLLKEDYGITDNVVYMRNSIDTEAFRHPDGSAIKEKYGFKPEEKILIYVGRMAPEKNLPFMIDAFRKINSKCPSKLMIIGEGPELENFRKYASEHDPEGRIIFTGRVEYADIPAYYGAADLFIMTSTTEVKPLALLEAMAAGLPIVAVSACGASDTVNDGINGYLTEEDRDAFADKVIGLLSDKDLLESMGREAEKTAEEYSGETIYGKLSELYEREINRKRRMHRYSGPLEG